MFQISAGIQEGWPILRGPEKLVLNCTSLLLWQRGTSSARLLFDTCREGMSRQEAEELVKTALALAMSRDGSSGGLARLVTLTKAGAERKLINHDDIPAFWDELEVLKTNGIASSMVVV